MISRRWTWRWEGAALAFLESVCRRSKTPVGACPACARRCANKSPPEGTTARRGTRRRPPRITCGARWGGEERTRGVRGKRGGRGGGGRGRGRGSARAGDRAGGGGGDGMRERSRDAAAEEAWERTRRERTRDRSGATTGSGSSAEAGRGPRTWRPAPPTAAATTAVVATGTTNARGGAVGARASRAAADDLLQAELRSEGLGRGRAKRE